MYRLTSETIASDPNSINGVVSYTYDAVGNRKQMSSTLAPIPAGLFNYDANDRFTAGDTYDNNGNTVSSGGIGNVYDFENHLIQKGGATMLYDGDGNRVFKTVAGVTTGYMVDDRNPTRYVQVMDEVQGPSIVRSYVYGLEMLEQDRIDTFHLRQSTSYNVYDGHGSVRALTDLTGAVTDTYDYDAFGNLIHSTGTTPNVYLYSGEQFDPDLHLYYNRARYLNVSTGRFWTMDPYEGDPSAPLSLHKYLYVGAEPINRNDRTGHGFFTDISIAAYVYTTSFLSSFGTALTVARLILQISALALVAADAAGYLTADRSLFTTFVGSGGNPASEIGVIYGEVRSLRTALAVARAQTALAQTLSEFSQEETAIINEAKSILGSPEIAKIKQAFAEGKEIQVLINGRTISYQPGLAFSGMTDFENGGFRFGDQAFTSDKEFASTVLHELYRLSPPVATEITSGASAEVAQETTLRAYQFALRAIGKL